MLQETHLRAASLIAPIFVKDGLKEPEPVASMPEVYRYNPEQLIDHCRSLRDVGIQAVALFPCNPPELKDPFGSAALDSQGLIARAVGLLKKALPEMTIIVDVALDPFTSHGHDVFSKKTEWMSIMTAPSMSLPKWLACLQMPGPTGWHPQT